MSYKMRKIIAARHRLKRELDTIHTVEGADPLNYLGRVNKAANELALLECVKSVEKVNQHIIQNPFNILTAL